MKKVTYNQSSHLEPSQHSDSHMIKIGAFVKYIACIYNSCRVHGPHL